jgi:hypothetical protein
MTRYRSARGLRETICVSLVLLSGALLASCGGSNQSPEEFYAELVKAAREKNGGYMYDVLDSAQQASIDTMIGMQMANLDSLPASERGRWDSLQGQSKRDIYAKVLMSDRGLADIFNTEYKVLKVDTLVVVQVQHTGQSPNTIYFRPTGSTYEIATPPRLPEMPAEHPPMQAPPGQPGSGGIQGGAPTQPGGGPK